MGDYNSNSVALMLVFVRVLSAGWVPFQDTMQKQDKILFWGVRGFDFMDKIAHKTVALFLLLFCFCFQDSIPARRTQTKIRSSSTTTTTTKQRDGQQAATNSDSQCHSSVNVCSVGTW
jgi:hypothetical protein